MGMIFIAENGEEPRLKVRSRFEAGLGTPGFRQRFLRHVFRNRAPAAQHAGEGTQLGNEGNKILLELMRLADGRQCHRLAGLLDWCHFDSFDRPKNQDGLLPAQNLYRIAHRSGGRDRYYVNPVAFDDAPTAAKSCVRALPLRHLRTWKMSLLLIIVVLVLLFGGGGGYYGYNRYGGAGLGGVLGVVVLVLVVVWLVGGTGGLRS